jgi:hypothetical protein
VGASAEDVGPQELAASTLFLGAGVAAHQDHADQPDNRPAEAANLPGRVAAHGVYRVGGSGERDQGRVAFGCGRVCVPLGLVGIKFLAPNRLTQGKGREEENVERDDDPVAPEDEPDHHARARQGLHRETSASRSVW